jgi:predicted DNA-binding protein with PD1-like motif
MRVQTFGDRSIVRLETGERAVESLVGLLEARGVGFANLSAAGALRWARLGFWDPDSKAYQYHEVEEQLEVVSFQGNSSMREGSPFLHLHVALARRDLTVMGGHLAEAVVHPTLEVWLRTEELPVRRARDAATGLDLLDLPAS